MNRNILTIVVVLIVLAAAGWWYFGQGVAPVPHSASAENQEVKAVSWDIRDANPQLTNSDDPNRYEQAISVDVTLADNSVKRYSVGKAFGCTGSTEQSTEGDKKISGKVNCYFALSGATFVAYQQGGAFVVEKHTDDASGITNGKVEVVLEI